jgi:hypothetical protein
MLVTPRAPSRRARLASICLAAALAAAVPLHASVTLPATLDELTAEAELVVYARVAAIETRQAPGTLRVERVVALDVIRALKGTPPDGLRLVLPGGTFGRYRTIVPGVPELTGGDEGVLFLRASANGAPHLVGFSQGFLRVRVDPETGTRTVSAPVAADAEGVVVRGAPGRGAQPLYLVEARIAGVVLAQLRGRR